MPDPKGIIGVIPARYGSTRFPGKPLASIAGKPMVQHVYERASRSSLVSRVIVATDDRRILECVEAFGGEAIMTSPENPTGSDRVAEVASTLRYDFYVNIQGDEPLVSPSHIDACANLLLDGHPMSTLVTEINTWEEVFNPNIIKVVVSSGGLAIYFSRSPIPYVSCRKDDREEGPQGYLRHIGIYGYTSEVLDRLRKAGPCLLERIESLEQLRALWLGIPIKIAKVQSVGPCVDVPEDVGKVEAIMGLESKTDG